MFDTVLRMSRKITVVESIGKVKFVGACSSNLQLSVRHRDLLPEHNLVNDKFPASFISPQYIVLFLFAANMYIFLVVVNAMSLSNVLATHAKKISSVQMGDVNKSHALHH